jgi:hypothetical protein
VTMSSDHVAFNIVQPALPDAVYSYFNDELDCSVSWSPHPTLVAGIRTRVAEAVGQLPREWLMPPVDGELFDSVQAAEDRVMGHSLAAGFQIVGGQGSTAIRKNFLCIHHGAKPRNDWKLSETVVRDPTNPKVIISTRKRDDTHTWKKDCLWRCFLVPFVEVDENSNRLERWILRYGTHRATQLPTTSHSHSFAANPFIFPKHRNQQNWAREALPQATAMRDSSLSFRHAERILYGQGLKIDRKTYYNLARNKSLEMNQDGLLALVTVLEHDDWTYRTFWEWKTNAEGLVNSQVLKAVFFTNTEMTRLARRFTPDWMIQVDGTFNTNCIRMPLIDCLGVSNTGHSFLFAFCFVTSESADNWGFVLQCLEMTVYEGLPLPRVVLADQGMGLRAVFPNVWPSSFLQFCEWHAAENIKKRLAKQRYKREERDEIMDLVWRYLWSTTSESLEANRSAMKQRMKAAEQEYMDKYWLPKEAQLIRLFTSQLPNLNSFSTQRDEGQHPMLKTVLNHQLRLDEGVRKLTIEMKLAAERLQEAEQKDKAHNRRLLEANVWYLVKETVASWALMKLLEEWKKLEAFKRGQQLLESCRCTMVQRFGLPCLHDLERAYDEVIPLPLTLIHSRWWYGGGVESRADWRPSYGFPASQISRPTGMFLQLERPTTIIDTTNMLLSYREGLNKERQQRLDEAHMRATRLVLAEAEERQQFDRAVPRSLPPPVLPSWNRYAKSHDKTMKRMMTGAEAAEKDANTAEATEKRATKEQELQLTAAEAAKPAAAKVVRTAEAAIDAAAAAAAEEDSDPESVGSEVREVVFSTQISPPRTMLPPARPATPEAGRKRSFTLVHRTPDKPRAAPVEPTTPSNTIASTPVASAGEAAEAPASTTPARLDGRTRREGKNTAYLQAMVIERGRGRGRGRGT